MFQREIVGFDSAVPRGIIGGERAERRENFDALCTFAIALCVQIKRGAIGAFSVFGIARVARLGGELHLRVGLRVSESETRFRRSVRVKVYGGLMEKNERVRPIAARCRQLGEFLPQDDGMWHVVNFLRERERVVIIRLRGCVVGSLARRVAKLFVR
ncbi:MAG: hypothetical protein HDKAJFGB_01466 [Anaerolineae bacterium]|nr:hypothetical protein [Anaerolineae bacterium]